MESGDHSGVVSGQDGVRAKRYQSRTVSEQSSIRAGQRQGRAGHRAPIIKGKTEKA